MSERFPLRIRAAAEFMLPETKRFLIRTDPRIDHVEYNNKPGLKSFFFKKALVGGHSKRQCRPVFPGPADADHFGIRSTVPTKTENKSSDRSDNNELPSPCLLPVHL